MTNQSNCGCPNGSYGKKHTSECYEAEITQLRGNLSLAEEGLAAAHQDHERNSDIAAGMAKEIERLREEVRALRIGHGFKDPASLDAPASEPPAQPLGLGDPVTYAPRYPSKLPLEGWTVERLPPEPVYVIRHPEGSVIAVAAGEISRSAAKSECAHSKVWLIGDNTGK